MSDFTAHSHTPVPGPRRLLHRLPVVGWILRDLAQDFDGNIWYLILAVVSLWAIAVATWGLPALYLPAVAAVPGVFALLVTITRG